MNAILILLAASLSQSPDTLCLGDSIRLGWCRYLACSGPIENCQSTRYALSPGGTTPYRILTWQREQRWAVIVFNFGLHDISHGVPIEEYRRNLLVILSKLNAERIYFCTTTDGCPKDSPPSWVGGVPRIPGAVRAYNEAALLVMREHHIPVIDLYTFSAGHPEWKQADGIHYTETGYKAMAEYVKHALTP